MKGLYFLQLNNVLYIVKFLSFLVSHVPLLLHLSIICITGITCCLFSKDKECSFRFLLSKFLLTLIRMHLLFERVTYREEETVVGSQVRFFICWFTQQIAATPNAGPSQGRSSLPCFAVSHRLLRSELDCVLTRSGSGTHVGFPCNHRQWLCHNNNPFFPFKNDVIHFYLKNGDTGMKKEKDHIFASQFKCPQYMGLNQLGAGGQKIHPDLQHEKQESSF